MDAGIAGDPGDGAERLLDRLAERDTDIFCGVMVIDMKVAIRLHRDVDARMPGQQIQHMVEKADPGGNLGYACPIEVDGHLDIGLFGLALDGRGAHETCFSLSKTRPFNRLMTPSLLRDDPVRGELRAMVTGIGHRTRAKPPRL